MIHKKYFKDMEDLNNFVVNNSITRSQIVSIAMEYERGNPSWGATYVMFYYEPSILGDEQ